jgi:dipeptidyl aminopeptidase/acylaminoacyl peptidase
LGHAADGVAAPGATRNDDDASYSPDGSRIVLSSSRSGKSEIWVANADGSQALQLTSLAGLPGTPRWSPDGRWIVYAYLPPDGTRDIYIIESSGGPSRPLVEHPAQDRVPGWSHDGKWIYFTSNRTGQDQIFRVSFEGGGAVQITDRGGYVPVESADGRTLYYTKMGTALSPLFARPVAGGEEHQVLNTVSPRSFMVTADGIYYLEPGLDLGFALKFFRFTQSTSEVVTVVDQPPGFGVSVSPDRRRFLFTVRTEPNRDLMLVENFQ